MEIAVTPISIQHVQFYSMSWVELCQLLEDLLSKEIDDDLIVILVQECAGLEKNTQLRAQAVEKNMQKPLPSTGLKGEHTVDVRFMYSEYKTVRHKNKLIIEGFCLRIPVAIFSLDAKSLWTDQTVAGMHDKWDVCEDHLAP